MDRHDHFDLPGADLLADGNAELGTPQSDIGCETIACEPVSTTDALEMRTLQGRAVSRISGWSPTRRPPRHAARIIPDRLRRPSLLGTAKNPIDWTLTGDTSKRHVGEATAGSMCCQSVRKRCANRGAELRVRYDPHDLTNIWLLVVRSPSEKSVRHDPNIKGGTRTSIGGPTAESLCSPVVWVMLDASSRPSAKRIHDWIRATWRDDLGPTPSYSMVRR